MRGQSLLACSGTSAFQLIHVTQSDMHGVIHSSFFSHLHILTQCHGRVGSQTISVSFVSLVAFSPLKSEKMHWPTRQGQKSLPSQTAL